MSRITVEKEADAVHTDPPNHRLRPAGLALGLALLTLLLAAAPAPAEVTTSIQVGTNLMTIQSDADDAITVTCEGGLTTVSGDDPFVGCSGVGSFLVLGGPGDNAIDMSGVTRDEFTSLRDTDLRGGGGNDAIAGTTLDETLQGDEGNDRLTGAGGDDVVLGGNGSDTLTWSDGDGNDQLDGGEDPGADIITVSGDEVAGDSFSVTPSGTGARVERGNLDPFSLEVRGGRIAIAGGGGDDAVAAAPGLALSLLLDGDDGNDSLTGSDGEDSLRGGTGNDQLVGMRAQDFINGGDGDDVMIWNDGDGNDDVEGGNDVDTMEVNGAPDDDEFIVEPSPCPNAPACAVEFRVPAGLDISFSERLVVNGGGGDDRILGSKGMAETIKFIFNGDGGKDTLEGTDRTDLLSGGRGADAIGAIDGGADDVECGRGVDEARVDAQDRPLDCETVDGSDERVQLMRKSAGVRGGAAILKLRCAATARCHGTLALQHRGKALGTERFAATRRQAKAVRVRLNRRGRRLLAAPGPVPGVVARIHANDAAGNGWLTTERIRLLG